MESTTLLRKSLHGHKAMGYVLLNSQVVINPRRACAARVTVLSLSVCVCVCYLANSYAVNAQVQSKIRIECKCATKGF